MSFIDINGVSLRYDVQGAGKPVVLIHEMGGAIESWDLVTPLLTPKRRVIRYDKRGMGQSEKVKPPLKIDTMTDDLIALLDALGVIGKVPLVGTAVGGAIALHTAVRFPDRIAAVIATSPAISLPDATRAATLERVGRFERDGVRVAFEATAANGYPEELRGDKTKFAAFRARWLANDPVSFGAIYRMLGDMDLFDELASIKCPVLVIGGEFDRGRPPAVVEPIAKGIPGARFKVLPTGHYAGLQTPELVAAEISAFLDSIGA
ncbi:MAG: 3-oxoadipate enol-lactonase [Hyphomicrobiales bacterium]|nr:3-oxoadipate enol-lactonase [Hyphomicrobiales bacterium]